MSNDTRTATKSARKPWTVEQWIMIIKESITGILALLVVIFTLVIAMQAFSFAGTETKMSDAKDILLLMLGVAGVVIGYYFGRVPADARATQAQDQARDATAQAQEIKSEAESIASEMESMLSSAPSYSVEGNAQRGAGGVNYGTSGGAPATLNQDEWRKMRERVRRLQNMSREKM